MDAFFSFLLQLIAIFVPLFILFYFHQKSRTNLPPGTTGWPILGENLRWIASGPGEFIQNRMKMYSEEIFKTSIVGAKMAVFCGVEGNKFIFTNENKFSPWWPASTIKPVQFFPSSEETLVRNRGFYVEFLKPESLKRYIPLMDSTAREQLETDWAPFEEVKVYPRSQKYTFSLACRLFLGVEDPKLVKFLSDAYSVAVTGMFSVPVDFPGTAYNRAMKGGKLVKDEFLKIIKDRKKELQEHGNNNIAADRFDFLATLLLKTDENGGFMSEMEIGNIILGFMVASYDTTTSALTYALNYLAELPDIYNKVYEEVVEIAKSKGPEELLNWNDIQKMKYSWRVVCESLRLTPAAEGGFRENTIDLTYAGFKVPKGWKLFWSVHSTHKNPKYFSDPERFDPSRFEGNGPAPYTFVPFGGGSRMCPGKEYARLDILVYIYNVVSRFKLEKLKRDEKVIHLLSAVPENGLPLRLRPHSK